MNTDKNKKEQTLVVFFFILKTSLILQFKITTTANMGIY